jgi:hypothetical protein
VLQDQAKAQLFFKENKLKNMVAPHRRHRILKRFQFFRARLFISGGLPTVLLAPGEQSGDGDAGTPYSGAKFLMCIPEASRLLG